MKKFFKVVLVVLLIAAIGFGISTIFWLPKIISDKKEAERIEQIQPWTPEDLPSYNEETENKELNENDGLIPEEELFDCVIKNGKDYGVFFHTEESYPMFNEKTFKVIGKFTADYDFSARSSGGEFKYIPSVFMASADGTFFQGFLLDMYGDGIHSYDKAEYDRRFSTVEQKYVEVRGTFICVKVNSLNKCSLYNITIDFLSDNDERFVELQKYRNGSNKEGKTEEKFETIDLENGILVTDLTKLSKSDAYAETEFLLYKTSDEKYFGKTYKFKGSVGFFRDDKEIDAWKMRVWVYDDLVTPDGKAVRIGWSIYFSIGEKDTITLQEFKDMFQVEEENMARFVTVEGTLEKRVIDGRTSLFLENATYEIVK